MANWHTLYANGRWSLVSPEGKRCFTQGVNSVDHHKNWSIKYPSAKDWAMDTSQLLVGNGFNTSGCWSLPLTNTISFTPTLSFLSTFAHQRGVEHKSAAEIRLIDHPDFPEYCKQRAAELCEPNNHLLLGYFLDNELSWSLADNIKAVAHKYFSITKAAIRAVDSGHLILGCRFNRPTFDMKPLFKEAGAACDVISINYYGVDRPILTQTKKWYGWSNKPYMVSEFYAMADNGIVDADHYANRSGAGKNVKDQSNRAAFYRRFVRGCKTDPYCIGWHWFKYMDEPVEINGGSNKGIVGVHFTPYTELLNQMQQSNS